MTSISLPSGNISEAMVEAAYDAYWAEDLKALVPDSTDRMRAALTAALSVSAPGTGGAKTCATEGCGKPSAVHFIRGNVGSYYCADCYSRVHAGETERLAALSTPSQAGDLGAAKVKPLTFEKQNLDGTFWASEVSVSGMYRVKFDGSRWRVLRNDVTIGDAGSSMAGINIAQAAHTSRILSAISSTPAGGMDGWKTVDTAPKDSSKFLAYEKGRYFDCWWCEQGYGEAYWMDEADSEPNPSDWMPLPAAPHGGR